MRHISVATKNELIAALSQRYREGSREEKSRLLDQFVAISGMHRKHAMRLLRGGNKPLVTRRRPRIYDEAVHQALVVLWESSDRICGKRLKAMLPMLIASMERHGHLCLDDKVRSLLLQMSAATIDRALQNIRETAGGRRRRRSVASTALRRSVPIRTFSDWGNPPPGYVEADLVAHSGPVARGSFIQTLVLTDIATGWTECAPLLVREQKLLSEVLSELRRLMPFALLGFDTDNDSVFINETIRDYCLNANIEFTRCRPYRKNDQAFVEQKNGSVVRRIVGYHRYEGVAAAAVLADLYRSVRLFVNFFQPSFKLREKRRDGAFVKKTYYPPATPCQRLIADDRTPAEVRDRLTDICRQLDPVKLLRDIRLAQQQFVDVAGEASHLTVTPEIEAFLASLRHAWTEGEVRPTARTKPKLRRERRRPDPLLRVNDELRLWFDEEPWRTGRQLLERLQERYPDEYPDQLLRTVQRRVKEWRREKAHVMIFGTKPEVASQPLN
ncbi:MULTISPECIES: integrase catalytic domain-containing protein [Brucella/Ochrobactrum group]|uniref:integrase catalytic domain-containing protein n=1 Tax=Brucella/Ochrobactrum group TaxID=2826938 RepID=UPI00124BECC8|nr:MULTISPECIES: DDE-type integrase/transposase/recombinase [Brucella/Ochrobactrum group]KAB2677738.1 transposase family protein [Brucella pseudintermedia]NKE75311.1 transposase family protein [Ochrobactrum sp. MC-1LL]